MKLNALALVGALLAAPVVAQPIYIDIGGDYGGNSNTVGGTNTTGWIDEMGFAYSSWSTVKDEDSSGGINLGDTIYSTGGVLGSGFNFSTTAFGDNKITDFLPGQVDADADNLGPSDNGYGKGWALTFGFNNLVGKVNAFNLIDWVSGTISFYARKGTAGCTSNSDLSCLTRLFDMEISSGGDIGNGTVINGILTNFNTSQSINSVLAAKVFNTSFGGSNQSFLDIHNTLDGNGDNTKVSFKVDQNTQAIPAVASTSGDIFTLVKANHSGRISFDVPEPTSIAVLGLGLLGLGLSRRKSAK